MFSGVVTSCEHALALSKGLIVCVNHRQKKSNDDNDDLFRDENDIVECSQFKHPLG